MSCFPCFTSQRSKKSNSRNENGESREVRGEKSPENKKEEEDKYINAKNFTFRELATATKNFRQECLLGEGGFGRVYKGTIQATGQLTLHSDIYSFGVVFLELITGRRAIDTTRPNDEQNLVSWAQPFFRDPKKFPAMADPLLDGKFPEKDLNQAVAVAAMCLQEEPSARPLISDVVTTLSFLSTTPVECSPALIPTPPEEAYEILDTETSSKPQVTCNEKGHETNNSDYRENGDQSSESEDNDSSEYEDECGDHGKETVKQVEQFSQSYRSPHTRSASSSSKSSSGSNEGSVCSSYKSSKRSSSSRSRSSSSSGSNRVSSSASSSRKSSEESISFDLKENMESLTRSNTKGSRNGSFTADQSEHFSFRRNDSIDSVGSHGRSECLEQCYSIGSSQDGIISSH
ncbi:hypothetical protein CsatA_006950 [Cannabis sativa]